MILFLFTLTAIGHAQLQSLDLAKPGSENYRLSGKFQGDETMEQVDGAAMVPVYQNERETYALTAKARDVSFDHLSTKTNFVPTPELADYQFGGAWGLEDHEHGKWGISANFGSASNKPFHGADVNAFSVTGTHQYATSERTSWLLLLNYSNNRAILNNIPLLGFVYNTVSKSKTHGWSLGFPFVNFWYAPSSKLMVSAFYVVPSTFIAQAGYFVWGPVQANFKFEYTQQMYLRHDRTSNADRIFYDQKRLVLSAKAFCSANTFFEFEVAKVFDQSLYDGRNAFALRSQRLVLPEEWRGGASLQVSF